MAHVVDYATPPQRRRQPSVWLIVLLAVTVPALLTAVAMLRQREAAMRALQAQQKASQMAAQAARQRQAAFQQPAQTRPAEPETQPAVEQP